MTEQKRQLQLQSSSRDGYLSQMNDLDEKFGAVLKQADFISEQMEKLEANGIYSGTSNNWILHVLVPYTHPVPIVYKIS